MTPTCRRWLILCNSATLLLVPCLMLLLFGKCPLPIGVSGFSYLIGWTFCMYVVLSPFALWAAINSKYPPGILVAGYPVPIAVGAILACIMHSLSSVVPMGTIAGCAIAFITALWTIAGAVVAPICSAVVLIDLGTKRKNLETKVLGCGGRKHQTLPPPEVAS